MSLQMSDAGQKFTKVVVGSAWPKGDEDQLRELATAWGVAHDDVERVIGEGDEALAAVLAAITAGALHDRLPDYWAEFTKDPDGVLRGLAETCTNLQDACDDYANSVEYTKAAIIAALIALGLEIATAIAAAFFTFGASLAAIPGLEAATAAIVRGIFGRLLSKIVQESTQKIIETVTAKIISSVVLNEGMNLFADVVIQGAQRAQGHRHGWDSSLTAGAAFSGFVSGMAGAAGAGVKHGAGELGTKAGDAATRVMGGSLPAAGAGWVGGKIVGGVASGAGQVGIGVVAGGTSAVEHGGSFSDGVVPGATTGITGAVVGGAPKRTIPKTGGGDEPAIPLGPVTHEPAPLPTQGGGDDVTAGGGEPAPGHAPEVPDTASVHSGDGSDASDADSFVTAPESAPVHGGDGSDASDADSFVTAPDAPGSVHGDEPGDPPGADGPDRSGRGGFRDNLPVDWEDSRWWHNIPGVAPQRHKPEDPENDIPGDVPLLNL